MLSDPSLSEEERQIVQGIVDRVENMMQKHDESVRILKKNNTFWSKIKRWINA